MFDDFDIFGIHEITEHTSAEMIAELQSDIKTSAARALVNNGWPRDLAITPELKLARKEFLLKNLDKIHRYDSRDIDLLQEHSKEFVAAAKATQKNDNSSLYEMMSAAWIFQQLEGSKNQLGPLMDFYVEKERGEYGLLHLCRMFSPKQIASEPKCIDFLNKKIQDKASGSRERVACAEALAAVKPKLLETTHWEIARDTEDSGRADSIAWLIAETESAESFETALDFLNSAEKGDRCDSYSKCMKAILNSKRFTDEEFAQRFQDTFESLVEKEAYDICETILGRNGYCKAEISDRGRKSHVY